ncbi:MAG: class I SAM-dependent methyltransferase [Haloarculaceae archaeon]
MNADQIRRQWAERSGEFSPAYYAYYGPDRASELVRDVLDRYLDRDARVLELGCSSGRHLAHLHDHGFENLVGIELNEDALDVMAEAYPELADAGTFYFDAIEDVVEGVEDGWFDAVYSVQTLQHVHPESAWVFEELVRITDDLLVTVENEGGGSAANGDGDGEGDRPRSSDPEGEVNYVNGEFPLFYRDWNRVFTDLGLLEVEAGTDGRDTLRAFRPPDERPGKN